MNAPQRDPLAEPIPAFRIAFAVVGALVFGSTTLVGIAALVAGDYTTTLTCDRLAQTCKLQYRSAEKSFPLAELNDAERRHEDRGSARGSSEEFYIAYSSGKKDFLCALPADDEATRKLEAHAADVRAFVRGDERKTLQVRCQGKVTGLFQGLVMVSLSALLAAASVMTLIRGFRQMRQMAGQKGQDTLG